MADAARGAWLVVVLAPLGLLALVLASPGVDESWENHPGHFWLVLLTASTSVGLGYAISVAARRRHDARLFLVSLAFVSAAGFLGLHALATPGVLVGGKNGGFELATPVGLALAAAFAAASGLELHPAAARRVMRIGPGLLVALGLLMALWAGVSLSRTWPLDRPLQGEQLNGWQIGLAVVGVLGYGAATLGYRRLYARRRERILLAVTLAFGLLAEAMLVIVWARNWHVSWWEWHALMLGAFTAIALGVRAEWYQERYAALYLDDTLSSARDVSVLFADLAGFTSFSEGHTLAEVGEMLGVYFGRLVPLLEDGGGEVHQLIGDEIMAVFDGEGEHAVVAARAALALQEAAGEVAAGRPDWPRFRVGINSGVVLAGIIGASRGHRKHDILGDTVNLAARLQAEAPVGGVVVGAGTAERLTGGAELERLPDLVIKGKQAPVEAYVLRSV
jgi:adenylate cyclase